MSCEDTTLNQSEEASDQAEEALLLQKQLKEITELTEGVTCEDLSNWAFTPIGNKPCGGPSDYLAYPLSIDTDAFLAKVEAYTQAHKAFNEKWGLISDCALEPMPSGISCKSGKAILVY
ncbi:MAG: hypothetical protein ACPGJS_03620 [Flammeovirgaceae bacterium]